MPVDLRYKLMIEMPLENCSVFIVFRDDCCKQNNHQKKKKESWRTDVFARRVEVIVVVEIGQGREEALGSAALVADHEALLLSGLDVDELEHGSCAIEGVVHDLLVRVERVLGGALEERLGRDGADVLLAFGGVGVDKVAPDIWHLCVFVRTDTSQLRVH